MILREVKKPRVIQQPVLCPRVRAVQQDHIGFVSLELALPSALHSAPETYFMEV